MLRPEDCVIGTKVICIDDKMVHQTSKKLLELNAEYTIKSFSGAFWDEKHNKLAMNTISLFEVLDEFDGKDTWENFFTINMFKLKDSNQHQIIRNTTKELEYA